ncbi:MAG: ABC transporter substrate-binding protein [Promethearchaeota archaeon]
MRKKIAIIGICLIFLTMSSMGTKSTNATKFYNPAYLVRYPWGDAVATAENPFTALAFRQAMSMAFDYNAFLNDVVSETGFRLEGMIPKGIFGHHDRLLIEGILPTYQPDAAKALFDAVGWTGTITLIYKIGNVIQENIYLNFKNSIEAMNVGIEIKGEGYIWDPWISVPYYSQPIFSLGWNPDYPDPDNYVHSFFHSEQGYFAPIIGYANPALDDLLVQAVRETDEAIREQFYLDIEEKAVRDMVWLYLYQGQTQSFPRVWLEDYEESGSLNPMSKFPNVQWINKITGTVANPQDTFILEHIGWPDPIDPAYNYESFGEGINELTRETLLQYRWENTTLAPALATSYDVSEDAKNITFHLRQGITYHDGCPFNAYTMKYSIDRAVIYNDPFSPVWMITPRLLGGNYFYFDNPNVSDAIEYLRAGGVQALDEYTLKICQSSPYVPLLYALQHQVCAAVSPRDVITNIPYDYEADVTDDDFGMVPLTEWFPDLTEAEIRYYLNLTGTANLNVSGVVPGSLAEGETAHEHMNTWSVGTGPYILDMFNPTNYTIRLQKNTNWWGEFAPLSPDYIKIYGERENATERIQDLIAGDCDVTWVPVTQVDMVQDPITGVPTTGLQYFQKPSFRVTFAGFNVFDEGSAEFLDFNGTIPPTTITPIATNGDPRTETTTLTETTTEYSSVAGSTKTTTEHYTITFTNERSIPGFEIVFTMSWLFLVSVIVLLHRREKVER